MPTEDTLIARIRELESERNETLEAANRWEGNWMRLFQSLDKIRDGVSNLDRSGISDSVCGLLDWIVRSVDDAIGPPQQQGFEPRCAECGRRQISGSDHFGNCSHARNLR